MNIRTMNPRGIFLAVLIAATSWGWPATAAAEEVHVAFGDIATVESLNFLIALERAKERGVDVKVTFFKSEDVAAQAVVSGEADIGVGTPYALIQKVKAPIRIFYQMSALRFFPIVNTEFYKTWKDLDGQEVAVHARGAPDASLAPLISGDAVVARSGLESLVVVRCADLARVSDVTCPLPASLDGPAPHPARELFVVPNRFYPSGFVEPGPEAARLPVQTVFVPTDGTVAAEERVRTLAARSLPSARTVTSGELAARATAEFAWAEFAWGSTVPPAMAFVLLVAACSLTVATVSGLMERRRPFALLRASGVRIGELRRIVLLETGVPLVLTALGGVGTAMLVMFVSAPREDWEVPDVRFFAGLGIGVLAALAVSALALPLLDVATRHDSARFE